MVAVTKMKKVRHGNRDCKAWEFLINPFLILHDTLHWATEALVRVSESCIFRNVHRQLFWEISVPIQHKVVTADPFSHVITFIYRVARETRPGFGHLWNYLSWVFFYWNGTIGNTSVSWFMVFSPKIDIIWVQTFAANCCNFCVGGHRHVGIVTVDMLSNLGTRNLFCYHQSQIHDSIISRPTKQQKTKILLVQEFKSRNNQMSVLLQIW